MTAAPRRGVNPVVFGAGVWAGVIVSPRTMGSLPVSSVLARGRAQGVGAVDGGVHGCAGRWFGGAPRRWRFGSSRAGFFWFFLVGTMRAGGAVAASWRFADAAERPK